MSVRSRVLPPGWYPGSAGECERTIEEFLTGFTPPSGDWIGGVAPHAGWSFSGRAAAKVVKTLASSGTPDRIVVLGGHSGAGSPSIVYTDDAWETPFGPLTMDSATARELVSSGFGVEAGRGFADNTVEVQLPFVKYFFPDTPVIAVHAPASEAAVELSAALDDLLTKKGLKVFYLGSADLTHYGPNYGFSPKGTGPEALRWVKEENDQVLIEKALAMDHSGLLKDAAARQNTCSAGPIVAVISVASRKGITSGSLIEYYTSHDIMPGSSFVGYAAIVF